jgi:hypothetical protein
MIKVKCTYQDGNTVTTDINGILSDAANYFIGNYFNIGHIEDNVQKCVRVEQLN